MGSMQLNAVIVRLFVVVVERKQKQTCLLIINRDSVRWSVGNLRENRYRKFSPRSLFLFFCRVVVVKPISLPTIAALVALPPSCFHRISLCRHRGWSKGLARVCLSTHPQFRREVRAGDRPCPRQLPVTVAASLSPLPASFVRVIVSSVRVSFRISFSSVSSSKRALAEHFVHSIRFPSLNIQNVLTRTSNAAANVPHVEEG